MTYVPESLEARQHRYMLLNTPARCCEQPCDNTAIIWVQIQTPDKMTGSSGCYCYDHAENGVLRALRFVTRRHPRGAVV